MSDLKASVSETKTSSGHVGFHVEGYEKIEYDFTFIDGVFNVDNPNLADCYKKWGRVLAVTDLNIYNVYGKQMEKYFQHYDLELKIHKTKIGEKAKTMPTLLSIVDSMNEFGIYRKAPIHTFLDFTFLKTLPTAQIRNGFAELIKISTCSHLDTFNLLDKYCEQLIDQSFGRAEGSPKELIDAADRINREGIHEMLKLETPNLHEIGLDRVIAYGHTWSPLHELVPETPLRHGHAISIDMAYSATLANQRKLISDEEHRRLLNLFSRAGLSMDHHQFDEEILAKATAAILKTRDVPNPIGSCTFLNDVTAEEMNEALRRHKQLMKEYPRNGEGLEAYVDSSDTGYTENAKMEEEKIIENAAKKAGQLNGSNGHVNGTTNGVHKTSAKTNGHVNGNGALSNGTSGNAAKVNGNA
ncbi:putative 2-epi-5-epi-valiolone synthase [Glarea lozoyensis 74030]|uniref:Putative 2-epi-5-epi-valiolone synthase n=1 Tax=Glarea lozoyensis (strain ATCC 74030 / MF5533) TaxID=1104152 RepID=H0EIU5_GLAL7|nr:putative 2-epi-5-epi-valiolone synthase [Glarea lozoyensis 74030]